VYALQAIDRRGRASSPTAPVEATPLPLIRESVFTAEFRADTAARRLDARRATARSHANARIERGSLDLRQGGHVAFNHLPEFDLRHAFSVSCWVNLDRVTEMPVVLSCGQWQGDGWFLQILGKRWRWYLGGVACDGGDPPAGRWVHVAATFDGQTAHVYQDGARVVSTRCTPSLTPWPGPLTVGQYAPGPAAAYQVDGRIAELRIYHRALSPDECAALSRQAPAE
jgi:hypothetical protein